MAHKVNTLNCQLTIGKNALDAAFGAFDINDCALIKKKHNDVQVNGIAVSLNCRSFLTTGGPDVVSDLHA